MFKHAINITAHMFVPLATLGTTIAPLNSLDSILGNEKLSLLRQTTGPTLDNSSTGGLMENAVGFQTIVGVLTHKYLRLSQLNIALGKLHRNRLVLHAAYLFRATDSFLLRVERSIDCCSNMLLSFRKASVDQTHAQVLCFAALHIPRQLCIRHTGQQHTVASVKSSMWQAHWETRTGDLDSFQDTTVSELLRGTFSRHEHGFSSVVWFDATNVVRICFLYTVNQCG